MTSASALTSHTISFELLQKGFKLLKKVNRVWKSFLSNDLDLWGSDSSHKGTIYSQVMFVIWAKRFEIVTVDKRNMDLASLSGLTDSLWLLIREIWTWQALIWIDRIIMTVDNKNMDLASLSGLTDSLWLLIKTNMDLTSLSWLTDSLWLLIRQIWTWQAYLDWQNHYDCW